MAARFEIIQIAPNPYGDVLGEAEVHWPGKVPQLFDIYGEAGVIHCGPNGGIAAGARFGASDLEVAVHDTLRTQLLEHSPDLVGSSN
jgi:hypothetical protein